MRPSSTWVLQRVQILGLRGLRLMPNVRYTALNAPDSMVPQTLHCAASCGLEWTCMKHN